MACHIDRSARISSQGVCRVVGGAAQESGVDIGWSWRAGPRGPKGDAGNERILSVVGLDRAYGWEVRGICKPGYHQIARSDTRSPINGPGKVIATASEIG